MNFVRFLKLLEIPSDIKRIIWMFNNAILLILLISYLHSMGVIITGNTKYVFQMWAVITILWPSIDFFSNSMQLYINRKDHHNKKGGIDKHDTTRYNG